MPRSPFFFGTDNVLHLEIVIDSLSMGRCWCGAFRRVSPFTTWCQKWDSNWQLVKLQLTCEDHAFLWFYIGISKEIIFLQIHSINLRKEENLSFDNTLFVNDSSVINKISLFDLTMCSQSGKGEVGMFILSIHCMKKSPTSKNMISRKGKKSMKGEFKWILNDWNWISAELQNCSLKIKVCLSF